MNVPRDFLEGASIRAVKGFTDVPTPEERAGLPGDIFQDGWIYELDTSAGSFGFDVYIRFESGDDFVMFINDFGSVDKYGLVYKSFTDDEADAIKRFLESYFLNQGFESLLGKFPLAVYCNTIFRSPPATESPFAGDWILRGDGELYENDGNEFTRVDNPGLR